MCSKIKTKVESYSSFPIFLRRLRIEVGAAWRSIFDVDFRVWYTGVGQKASYLGQAVDFQEQQVTLNPVLPLHLRICLLMLRSIGLHHSGVANCFKRQ